MRSRVHWARFRVQNAEASKRIQDLILPVCEKLQGKEPEDQIILLQKDHACAELRDLLWRHKDILHLEDDPYAYLHWIMERCFSTVMRAEHARAR